MESLLLVSNSEPRRIAIQPISNQGKKASYVLILENLASRVGENINCTARFQPAASFDSSSYSQLIRQPVKGCVGLVQVENGKFHMLRIIHQDFKT